ncbi:MAG: hypothetical protein WBX01_03370 [Nitrososphaeraceae archaeon]|jgi:hypothetical protein
MTIRFLHGTPLDQIDQLCKEEEMVKVSISCYHTEHYSDGTSELVLTSAWSSQIKSSKDLFQFDNKDMQILSKETKEDLR